MLEKLKPFYKLLKAETSINETSELNENFYSVNKALSEGCKLALKQPSPRKNNPNDWCKLQKMQLCAHDWG